MVSNSLTFAIGPRLLRQGEEDVDHTEEGEHSEESRDTATENRVVGAEENEHGFVNEETSLLPHHIVRKTNNATQNGAFRAKRLWKILPSWAHPILNTTYQFLNAPLVGAIVGVFIGLIPPLHRVFFNPSSEGGFMRTWLTAAVKNIGDLFASLQIIVVGVKLSQSLLRMKNGEESGKVPVLAIIFITLVRFFIWPM